MDDPENYVEKKAIEVQNDIILILKTTLGVALFMVIFTLVYSLFIR